jgi:hypothetical protein
MNLQSPAACRMSLTNSLGQEVYAQSYAQISDKQTLQVNVSSLIPGVYFCRISTPDASLLEKVIIAK